MTTDYPRIGSRKSWNWWRSVPFQQRRALLLVWLVIASLTWLAFWMNWTDRPKMTEDVISSLLFFCMFVIPGILAPFLTVAVRFRVWGANAKASVAVLVVAIGTHGWIALVSGPWKLPRVLLSDNILVHVFVSWLVLALLWWWAVDRNVRVASAIAAVGWLIYAGSWVVAGTTFLVLTRLCHPEWH